jgi:hypothetical protein
LSNAKQSPILPLKNSLKGSTHAHTQSKKKKKRLHKLYLFLEMLKIFPKTKFLKENENSGNENEKSFEIFTNNKFELRN